MIKTQFKVESLRKIPCPFGRDKDSENPQSVYIAICHVKNLPDNIPMSTNPREQNLNTKVAKAIIRSLLYDRDAKFHLLNRGIVLSADKVNFNNDTNIITVTFTNLEKHGNIDGGHTYEIIKQYRDQLDFDQFVRIEIITGVEDYFEELAGARNTSVQVQDKSLAELEGHFQIIKDALKDQPFFDNIAFKENAKGDIDITDIIAILTMFNIERFDSNSHPVIAYSSKKKCVDYYLEDVKNNSENNAFVKLYDIAADIFSLYSYIEENLPKVYNSTGGKYGRLKGVIYKEQEFHPLVFSDGKKICYESPKGFIYPILAAFRALVEEDPTTGRYRWKLGINPKVYFDNLAAEMVTTTVERSKSLGNNPQSVGKDTGHWGTLYKIVENKLLQDLVKSLSN